MPPPTATALAPGAGPAPPVVSPAPGENEADARGVVSRESIARSVLQQHKRAVESRREHDLIAEKLLLHIDGSGDFQWADIFHGARVEIPTFVSEFRKTENLLRPIVANAVAHHTTMPLHYTADSAPDRRSREKAIIDTLWANYLAYIQDFNGLFAEAMNFAMPCGFGIVHGYWREDISRDFYEPIGYQNTEEWEQFAKVFEPGQGMIDCFVGNPFGTYFDVSAKRGSVRWCSYERILPADLVREHFSHVPEVHNVEGATRIPSIAEFHRIAKSWMSWGLGVHGDPVISDRRGETEELLTVICREVAPRALPDYPEGRLQIIAVPGQVDLRRAEGRSGQAILLADQPLPAGEFSWELFYSDHRTSDVHGKPWAEDIDQLQVDLNIALSKRWEYVNKMVEAPIVAPGGAITEDMAEFGQYSLLEIEPSLGAWRPKVMEWSQGALSALDNEIAERRRAMYTLGGYQASSRGEAPGSRMAYRAIVALQEADRSVHGPVNMRFQRSAAEFMKRMWRQMKTYGDQSWLVTIASDEYAHLVPAYISKHELSERPPKYKLTNAFGTSPELRAQEILQLAGTRGADGEPFLTTAEARRLYPDRLIFDDVVNPGVVQRRRARTVAKRIHDEADRFRAETGMTEDSVSHPWVRQAALQVFQLMEQEFPRLRDDDLGHHLAALSEITQDPTADAIARLAAQMRQELLFQWQAMMAAQAAGVQPGPGGGGAPPQGGPGPAVNRPELAQERAGGGGGGTTLDQLGAAG